MTSISDRAMIANQTIRRWSARRFDAKVTDEVHQQHNATEAGRWNKILIPPKALREVNQVAREARLHHYGATLPWEHDGARILPASLYFDYSEKQADYRRRFDAAVADFVSRYDQLKQQAAQRLNGMFDASEYPTREELPRRFGISISISPLPDADDWRVTLGTDEEKRIRDDIKRRTEQLVADATNHLWRRLHDAVSRAADRLGDRDGRLHASVITSLRELCEVLPQLNIAGDPQLENMRQEVVNRLGSLDVDALRQDKEHRADAGRTAANILTDMAGYIGD